MYNKDASKCTEMKLHANFCIVSMGVRGWFPNLFHIYGITMDNVWHSEFMGVAAKGIGQR